MFTQDKVLWTIYILWAQLWRMGIIGLAAGTSIGLYLYFRGENFSSFEILPMVMVGIPLYLLIIYIQYYTYFEKSFASFNQEFLGIDKPTFFSWRFWKPYLLISTISFAVGFILGMFLPSNIAEGLSFMFGLFFQHICIHGETWGFKLTAKPDDNPRLTT